ncbi:MAG: Gfo/Idh/MocA family oxidoreductase [Spirochaetaceae bacterium]|jgi:predicted dehydrogenase|nr:Gfo/Idh/MocA family oxidoreductase [Spirochaetaceae bacterium]
MEKLRMGVLGCSAHYALRVGVALKSSLLVEPYAVASRNAAKAGEYAEFWNFAVAYDSYEKLLADPQVDFVYCPLPNHLHGEYIKKAADAGKPILCEKPLGLTARDAADAAEYCRKKGVLVMEAFMYRFHPQWIRAAEIVKSGELGKVLITQGIFTYNNTDPANIRNISAYGGGGILDIGCYMVSTARLLQGAEPQGVICKLLRDPSSRVDILAGALLDFGEGRSSSFTVGTQIFPRQKVTALGTGGCLTVELPFNMYGDYPGRVSVSTAVGERLVETEIADQYLLEFDAFAEAIINKTGAPIPVSDGIANMAVLDALFASANSGKWEPVQKF